MGDFEARGSCTVIPDSRANYVLGYALLCYSTGLHAALRLRQRASASERVRPHGTRHRILTRVVGRMRHYSFQSGARSQRYCRAVAGSNVQYITWPRPAGADATHSSSHSSCATLRRTLVEVKSQGTTFPDKPASSRGPAVFRSRAPPFEMAAKRSARASPLP